jgi:pimeloyl-ACP methyl ester carboxylesterase
MAFKLAARCQPQRDYSPVAWTNYFDEAHDVHVGQNQTDSFRVYLRNFQPPYAPARKFGQKATSVELAEMTQADLNQYSQYPTLVMLHGGGYSALTWAQFTRHIEQECHCRLMAIDLRSHGDTKTDDDDKMDIDTLVDDVIQVIHAAHRLCGYPETPKIILVGHSMGGAIAIKCSAKCSDSLAALAGFVIIDVVEGTAKDALPLMMTVIKTRPIKFPSLPNAIEWSVRSGMAKNLDAARVSMPGNLLNMTTGHLAIHDIDDHADRAAGQASNITKHKFHINLENLLSKGHHSVPSLPPDLPKSPRLAQLKANPDGFGDWPPANGGERQSRVFDKSSATQPLMEEDSGNFAAATTSSPPLDESEQTGDSESEGHLDKEGYRKPPNVDTSGYCWRTDLARTQPHWPAWFEGLSKMMLDAPVQGKFLLLAGIDRLDRTLTIGQMQGKFMMRVLPKCGHAVHEDSPERVASAIGEFLIKNKFTTQRANSGQNSQLEA